MTRTEQTEALDSTVSSAAGDSRQTLSNEAVSLYQCPQGFLVKHPSECGDSIRASSTLPQLVLEGDPKPLDGKLPWPKPDPKDTGFRRS